MLNNKLMYTLTTPLSHVTGIGRATADLFALNNLHTVKDLLLYLPYRYVDRSEFHDIATAPREEEITLRGTLSGISEFYKNKRKIVRAKLTDETGSITLMWFNATFIKQNLQTNTDYFVSGKISSKYKTITQPTLEKASADTIHTNRLVPIYSTTTGIKPGVMRRLLKRICDDLEFFEDELVGAASTDRSRPIDTITPLFSALKQLHFPNDTDAITSARRRIALEELLSIIKTSSKLKASWQGRRASVVLTEKNILSNPTELPLLPFTLTNAQLSCTQEILTDLSQPHAMNRLLIGDVGSGKTVVAGIACREVILAGESACFIAPTKILAQQHAETLTKLFPDLTISLVTGVKKRQTQNAASQQQSASQPIPSLYVGTHAVINQLEHINPGLIVYDEQHRFGVTHRSQSQKLSDQPHILTMTATPIPRSLILTLFSHLSLSVIDELPPGRIPTTTWLIPEKKRADGYIWMAEQLKKKNQQALVICPFVDPSRHEALENVSAATEIHTELQTLLKKMDITMGVLHGRQKKNIQENIIKEMYQGKIDLLVTTPIVEVGVDLPQASYIAVEAAERFGLASLHQLRGRVGRAGQESFCLLLTTKSSHQQSERLKLFTKENNGLKLAEADLKHRGSGDMFGVQQHGFSQLKYGSWDDGELIVMAKQLFEHLPADWHPFFDTDQNKTTVLGN